MATMICANLSNSECPMVASLIGLPYSTGSSSITAAECDRVPIPAARCPAAHCTPTRVSRLWSAPAADACGAEHSGFLQGACPGARRHNAPIAARGAVIIAPRRTPRFVSPSLVDIDPARCPAALSDRDGVLTDTASVHFAAWKRMFEGYLFVNLSLHGDAVGNAWTRSPVLDDQWGIPRRAR